MNSPLLSLIAALAVALTTPVRGPCCCTQAAGEAPAACCSADSSACCQRACCQTACCGADSSDTDCCQAETSPNNSGPCGCEGCPAETPTDPASPTDPPAPPSTVDSADAGVLLPAPMPEDIYLRLASDPVGFSSLIRPPPERRALICVWTL